MLVAIFKALPKKQKLRCSSISQLPLFGLFQLLILIDLSLCQPALRDQQKMLPSDPQSAAAMFLVPRDSPGDPFQQHQRWLSARPFQRDYRRPQSEELGLLLQYLDTKRNAPSAMLEEDAGGRHSVNGSPLGTMRFGKRSPLGTMRFGKRSPLGTMRFGKRSFNSPLGPMRFG